MNEQNSLTVDVPELADDEIHLWRLDGPADAAPRLLSGLVHRALGQLLIAYSGCDEPPAILRGEHGKPYCADLDGLEFNVSHSGRHALIGVARQVSIGVDIEGPGRARSFDDIAQRYFAPSEAAALRALPEDQRKLAFLRLWTGKEAVLKALGLGLSFGLDRVEFSLDADGRLERLRQVNHSEADAAGFQWHVVDAIEGFHCVIAWQGPPRRLRLLTLP